MESSAEHVRQEPNEHAPLEVMRAQEPRTELESDDYAKAELESRKRRIELSIQKALRTT